jgi:L-amino acid N-acyltransferase YncA
MTLSIEQMTEVDWPEVSLIYEQGIASGHASFETEVPDWRSWNSNHLQECRLVARDKDQVIGWAALSPVSGRCVYGGVAEVSVYVAGVLRGQGIGTVLLQRLVSASEESGLWTLEAGIFPENLASITMHEKCGFERVGLRKRLGRLNGVWRDVLLLERRSELID